MSLVRHSICDKKSFETRFRRTLASRPTKRVQARAASIPPIGGRNARLAAYSLDTMRVRARWSVGRQRGTAGFARNDLTEKPRKKRDRKRDGTGLGGLGCLVHSLSSQGRPCPFFPPRATTPGLFFRPFPRAISATMSFFCCDFRHGSRRVLCEHPEERYIVPTGKRCSQSTLLGYSGEDFGPETRFRCVWTREPVGWAPPTDRSVPTRSLTLGGRCRPCFGLAKVW